jgi:hypothetical protein
VGFLVKKLFSKEGKQENDQIKMFAWILFIPLLMMSFYPKDLKIPQWKSEDWIGRKI